MWNQDLRSKVLERLRSLPSLSNVIIHEDDVCVMPYEEVQLICDPGTGLDDSIKLMDRPTSYLRFPESLDFYLLCDSLSVANSLVGDIRQNPEFTLSNLQLKLECRRGLVMEESQKFNVSVLPGGITVRSTIIGNRIYFKIIFY